MKIKFSIVSISIFLFLSGCTAVQVMPLSDSPKISKICIVNNPEVKTPGFLNVVRDGFERHGISSIIVNDYGSPEVSKRCQAVLTYDAIQSRDFVWYLSHAELRLDDLEGRKLAFAEFHLNAGGGLAFSKFDSVEEKMNPVIDVLLSKYK